MANTHVDDREQTHVIATARSMPRLLYPFEIPVLLYGVIGYFCGDIFGFAIHWGTALDFGYDLIIIRQAAILSLAVVGFIFGVRMLLGEPWQDIGRDLYGKVSAYLRQWRDQCRWLELLRTFLAIKLCLLIYTHLKQAIPLIYPELYDDQLWEIDRWLHMGFSPTYVTLESLSHPWVTRSMDMLYVLWYTVKVPFLVYFLFFADRHRRWHFLTCYMLVWMIGGAFAIWFPSLGPIYTDPELFAQIDMPSANVIQNKLWTHYQELLSDPDRYKFVIYDGVAAFPSLHVGIVVLFTAAIFHFRVLFWVMVVYSVVIQFGSVLLGWHYAVDGYFMTVLVVLIFLGTRWLFPQQQDNKTYDAPTSDS